MAGFVADISAVAQSIVIRAPIAPKACQIAFLICIQQHLNANFFCSSSQNHGKQQSEEKCFTKTFPHFLPSTPD